MNAQSIAGTDSGVRDYHAWHAVRINTCVAHLGLHVRHMADAPLHCLDLGHDPHMGAQLQELGLTVTGNIHPHHLIVNVPWTLAPFDFENPFPFENNQRCADCSRINIHMTPSRTASNSARVTRCATSTSTTPGRFCASSNRSDFECSTVGPGTSTLPISKESEIVFSASW
jgi:hypothetical protein